MTSSRNGGTQAVEIVDKPAAGAGQKQTIGAAVIRILPALQKTLFDQAVEQADQRDRLHLQHFGQIDLRKAFLLPQPEQHDPLRAGRSPPLGAVYRCSYATTANFPRVARPAAV